MLFSASALQGCVGWGKPYEVISANENQISIHYDPLLMNAGRAMKVAQKHCAQYDKTAIILTGTATITRVLQVRCE